MAIKRSYQTSGIDTQDMGMVIEEMMTSAKDTRVKFERKWYDNNFFDDGYHFRYLSRLQNKIVDLSDNLNVFQPMRAIPKASRQIRGVANLLTANDFVPVIYPEKVNKIAFQDPNEFQQATEEAKRIAKMSGHWVFEEFKNQDIAEKLTWMIMLAAKHHVSYLQIWPDAVKEKINTQVYDAFDIYLLGDMDNIQDQPFIGKGAKQSCAEIKANELFDEKQRMQIHPDNRYASSEIKEAYMTATHGRSGGSDRVATLILKEFFIKEYLDKDNVKKIRKQDNAGDILKNKDYGDPIIRHTWSAGNFWLRDVYEDLPNYPFVDYRMEPGPIYGTSLIERFIPANKSLDIASSRIERYMNSFPLGIIAKRKGEQYNISNIAGGQQVEYEATPPKFEQQAPLPNHVFNFLQVLNSYIEEQGLNVSSGGNPLAGVEAWRAIESLKESEQGNLIIAQRRLKATVKQIAERFLDLADKHFVTPQSFTFLEKGEPQYFDIIGKSALKDRERLKVTDGLPEDLVPISKEYRVEIEVETGMAHTRAGQRQAAKELGEFLIQLVQLQAIPPQVLQAFMQKLLDAYRFGNTGEVMEALEDFQQEGSMNDQQIDAVKVAVAQVLKDLEMVGPQAEEKLVESTKVGVVEALKDTGMLDSQPQNPKDQVEIAAKVQDMKLKKEEHELKMVEMDEELEMKKEEHEVNMDIKQVQAAHSMSMKEKAAKNKSMKKGA